MQTTRINNITVKPVISHSHENKKSIRGYDYIQELYANVCFLARKASGKTTTLYRILENSTKKGQNCYIFASTINIDPTYKKMIKMLTKKGVNVKQFDNFITDDGLNIIDEIVNMIQRPDENIQEPETVEDLPRTFILDDDMRQKIKNMNKPKKDKPKKDKPKKDNKDLVAENIFIFDDLATAMRHDSITRLLVKNRHLKSRCYISIHYPSQLTPSSLRMIDQWFLYPNIDRDKIDELGFKIGTSFSSDNKKESKLWEMYKDATCKKYNCLNIDMKNMIFKKNFNECYSI